MFVAFGGGANGFQSTPVIANGRIAPDEPLLRPVWAFQSTPVIANGRILDLPVNTFWDIGFNPRPLLLTGESRDVVSHNASPILVSIHARYC